MSDKSLQALTDEHQLRKYAETWIIVTTVILTITFAVILFVPKDDVKNPDFGFLGGILAVIVIAVLATSLGIFLNARDPRQVRYSTSKLIDLGVGLFSSSLFLGAISMGIREYMLSGIVEFAVAESLGIIAVVAIFYPIMYYLVRRKKTSKTD